MQSWLKSAVRPRRHAVVPRPPAPREDPALLAAMWGPGSHGLGSRLQPLR